MNLTSKSLWFRIGIIAAFVGIIFATAIRRGWIFSKAKDSVVVQTRERFTIQKGVLQNHPLTFVKLQERGIFENISLPGTVSYDLEKVANIGSRVTGKVQKVFVKEGDFVKKGTPLCSISSAELGNMESNYMKARARLDALKVQADRAKDLYERKVTSAKDYEMANMEYKSVKAELETSKNALENFGLTDEEIRSLENGKYNSLNLYLRAPISGTVTERKAILGQSVTTMDNLFTVADLSTLWIILEVYEKDLHSIKMGTEAIVTPLGATPDKGVVARVAHVSEVIDAIKHTADIRLEVRNARGALKPGQTVSATVQGLIQESTNVKIKTIPNDCVHKVEGDNYVFIQNPDGSFSAKTVELGRAIDEEWEILSGLTLTDKVVREGSFLLKSEFLRL